MLNRKYSVFSQFLLLASVLCAPLGWSHPGYYGTAFHAHTLEKAKNIAEKEHKIIFAHAGDNHRGWQHFRWPQRDTSALIDLLVRESVIVELNINDDQYQLATYAVSEPTILLLDANGKELQRLAGDSVAAKVQHEVTQLVVSQTGFARIQAAIESKNNAFFNQERHAAALQLAGRTRESIHAYDRCLTDAINEVSLAAKSRRPYIIGALQNLSKQDQAALTSLNKNRQYAAKKLMQQPGNGVLAADVAQIDSFAQQTQSSIELFNTLPKKSRARAGLFDYLSEDLRQQQRYEELLSLVDPLASINGEIMLYQRNRILKPASAERNAQRGTRSFAIQRSLGIIEALAATRKDELCQQAIDRLLSFDSSDETRTRLSAVLTRAGRHDISL